jgi:predicted O-methyltransferase YrrM
MRKGLKKEERGRIDYGRDDIEQVILDVERQCRERTIYMIGPEKAGFLRELVLRKKPQFVVECGTAIGYSGLHILAALKRLGRGRLFTIELLPSRAAEAGENFRRAGAGDFAEVVIGDAVEVLERVGGPVDFLFLDNDFGNYYRSFRAVETHLSDGALVLADNAGIGGGSADGYLSHVRSRFRSECRWFDTSLPWAERDAMEVTEYRSRSRSDKDVDGEKGRE